MSPIRQAWRRLDRDIQGIILAVVLIVTGVLITLVDAGDGVGFCGGGRTEAAHRSGYN